jgi:hypothetical protein
MPYSNFQVNILEQGTPPPYHRGLFELSKLEKKGMTAENSKSGMSTPGNTSGSIDSFRAGENRSFRSQWNDSMRRKSSVAPEPLSPTSPSGTGGTAMFVSLSQRREADPVLRRLSHTSVQAKKWSKRAQSEYQGRTLSGMNRSPEVLPPTRPNEDRAPFVAKDSLPSQSIARRSQLPPLEAASSLVSQPSNPALFAVEEQSVEDITARKIQVRRSTLRHEFQLTHSVLATVCTLTDHCCFNQPLLIFIHKFIL